MPPGGLSIRSDACDLDFLSLGALVHRLDPGVDAVSQGAARSRSTSPAASTTSRPTSRIASASDRHRHGDGQLSASANWCRRRVRETGVTPFYKWFEHDGVRGPNIATVYSDRGQGVRPPVVFYNRANEAGALLKPGDFDWPEIFAKGVRWFHSGGIFAALSETTSDLIIEGMQAAKAAGRDHLVRPELSGQALGVRRRRRAGQQVIRRIVGNVDALIGNEEDLQKGLGIAGPDVAAKSKLDPDTFFKLIDSVVEQHPNIKLVATTLREVHSTNRHDWAAVLWLDGQRTSARRASST